MDERKRCSWIGTGTDNRMVRYHDEEWGFPVHDDRILFEFLILEGVQAGLSWQTVLNKRENYRMAFHNFDPEAVARFSEEDVARLLADPGIIRNRRKITAAITNAKNFLAIREEYGSFDAWIWQFTGGKPIDHRIGEMRQIPATSPESEAMSRALKQRGFAFVGPTICYAFMQAVGMVNDHEMRCFRHAELSPG